MEKYYSITIPKPCHEDWNAMTPKEKGRFCDSCSKTVIDFTKMDTYQIQNFIHENKNNRICGHFKQTQLDTINLHIPSQILTQQQNFHKLFLLALLIAMGTTLMNCTNKNGDKQKIDSIEVIDTTGDSLEITLGEPIYDDQDSILKKSCSEKPVIQKITRPQVDPLGIMIIEPLMGDIAITVSDTTNTDSLKSTSHPEKENNKTLQVKE